MFSFQCRGCGVQLMLEDHWAGKQGRCPHCRSVLELPLIGGPAFAAEPAPAGQPPPAAEPPVVIRAAGKIPVSPRRLLLVMAAAGMIVIGLALVLAVRGFRPAASDDSAQAPAGATEKGVSPEGDREAPQLAEGSSAVASGPKTPSGQPSGSGPSAAGSGGPSSKTGVGPGGLGPAAAGQAPLGAASQGLTGVSRQYDDLQCRLIQARHSIRIPPGATILEVDGVRLPVLHPERLAESPAPYLFLPPGTHAVSFRPNERPVTVTIASNLFDEYQDMRRFFGVGGTVRGEELMSRSARVMDCHGAPFLLSFAGSRYAATGDWGAAERKFRRALGVNPAFSPAHLNLAECLLRTSAEAEAAREIALADAFNVGNVFGLAGAVAEFRQRVTASTIAGPLDAAAISYVTTETPTEEDRRLVALLEGVSKYAVRDEERGKILNNLAVHFADTGRPELALYHFHQALAALRDADPGARYDVARQVLVNMSEVCRKAGFGEAEEYRQMSVSLTGATQSAESP